MDAKDIALEYKIQPGYWLNLKAGNPATSRIYIFVAEFRLVTYPTLKCGT